MFLNRPDPGATRGVSGQHGAGVQADPAHLGGGDPRPFDFLQDQQVPVPVHIGRPAAPVPRQHGGWPVDRVRHNVEVYYLTRFRFNKFAS